MSAPPPGWSLQRPFEKETTAAEWFESTDIPLMAVVRGITEIPARSLEVTANYACILATGKRCDGSDPTPEDLESGYYSIMPGGGKGAAKNAVAARGVDLTKLGRAGMGKGVREVTGNAKDARKLFDQLRGNNPVIEKEPGVFVAKGRRGGNVTFRVTSKSGPPTVDVHGVQEGIRKIKFIE